jgi:hypothetical protein
MADLGWSKYVADWEAAEMGKCFEPAEKHGLTPLQAEDCDDGHHGCPECPWKKDLTRHPEHEDG